MVATPTLSLINCTLLAPSRGTGGYTGGREGLTPSLKSSVISSLKIKSVAKKWPSLIHGTHMRNMTLMEVCVKFFLCQI